MHNGAHTFVPIDAMADRDLRAFISGNAEHFNTKQLKQLAHAIQFIKNGTTSNATTKKEVPVADPMLIGVRQVEIGLFRHGDVVVGAVQTVEHIGFVTRIELITVTEYIDGQPTLPQTKIAENPELPVVTVETEPWVKDFDDGYSTDPRFTQIMEKLQAGQLAVVSLEAMKLRDADVIRLAEALTNDVKVADVWLNDNEIGARGARALAKMLETNTHLKTLGLRGNRFGNEGAKWFAKALLNNTVLQTLFLGSNGLTDNGCTVLAESLKINRSLKSLGLLDNNETPYGISVIEKAVQQRGVPLSILHNEDRSHAQHDIETKGNFQEAQITAEQA